MRIEVVCVCGGGRGGKEVKTAKYVWKRGLYGSANDPWTGPQMIPDRK